MRFKLRHLGVLALASVAMTACADNLQVSNENNPDLTRVYADPSGVEGVVSTLYRSYHQGTAGNGGIEPQSDMLSLESYSALANFGNGIRSAIPRLPINNQRGNQVNGGNQAEWNSLSRLMRTSATVVQAIDAYLDKDATLGTPSLDLRARAFAMMVNGLAMGTLATIYDSVAIATAQTPTSAIPGFVGPAEAMTTALSVLDSAIAIIQSAPSTADATIPLEWMGGTALTPAQLVRLIRTYKAKFRISVARTPGATIDWALVLADATNGITADHQIALGGTWSSAMDAGQYHVPGSWHQISLMYNGMADNSGNFVAFSAVPLLSRPGPTTLVVTPDTRWPAGATRAAQQANSSLPLPAGQYIANRQGEDFFDGTNPWGSSQYESRRWWSIRDNGGVGIYSFIDVDEINMIAAEANLALGNGPAAMTLVNNSRTQHGLAAFADPAGTAPDCVPTLPTGACGNLREAMKYEKRMETQLTGYMAWFLDSRRWGDLVQGTVLEWPVPNAEMDTRNQAFYDMPYPGATGKTAGVGTYGY
ncbi:MAG: hypothetical protein KF709_09370 [Gemmatimonadaceae bacterium]|nr:hypothetical protein [Gemmatimonadaceae bacterium]